MPDRHLTKVPNQFSGGESFQQMVIQLRDIYREKEKRNLYLTSHFIQEQTQNGLALQCNKTLKNIEENLWKIFPCFPDSNQSLKLFTLQKSL